MWVCVYAYIYLHKGGHIFSYVCLLLFFSYLVACLNNLCD